MKLLPAPFPALLAAGCVLAAGAAVAQSRFTPSADGTEVTDNRTGLVWRRCSEGQAWDAGGATCTGTAATYTHEAALARAQTQTGWRLPNAKELGSLADKSASNPAINTAAFPATTSNIYWTSTPYAGSPAYAWSVFFFSGGVGVSYGRATPGNVRLVR